MYCGFYVSRKATQRCFKIFKFSHCFAISAHVAGQHPKSCSEQLELSIVAVLAMIPSTSCFIPTISSFPSLFNGLPLLRTTVHRNYQNEDCSVSHKHKPSLYPTHTESFETIRASSLEDSKKRAKSSYDNIKDLNEQYLSELAWIQRKYGTERLGGKDPVKEAQKSIIVPDGTRRVSRPQSKMLDDDDEENNEEKEPDLGTYLKMRNRLFGDTLFVGALGICIVWGVGNLRDVISYSAGVGLSLVYVALLARSVDRMANAARESGGASGAADPLQAARVGLLAVSVIGAAKNTDKFSVVAIILGFLTYKLATLLPLLTGEAFES